MKTVKTYGDLLAYLNTLTEQELKLNISILPSSLDDYISGAEGGMGFIEAEENDILDKGHPILVINDL